MAPKKVSEMTAWELFQKDFNKYKEGRGNRGAPGSAFAQTERRQKVFKVVKHIRVRSTGRSVFSTLAHGLDIYDEDVGMGFEIVEVVEDGVAMRDVEERKRAKAEAEAAKEAELEKAALEEAVGKTSKAKGKGKGHGGPGRKSTKAKQRGSSEEVGSGGTDASGDGALDDGGKLFVTQPDDDAMDVDESEDDVIPVPVRRGTKRSSRYLVDDD